MHEQPTGTQVATPGAPEARPREKEESEEKECVSENASGSTLENSSEVSVPDEPGAEEKLREAELKLEETRDAWLRAQADVENTRRRAREDVARAAKFAVERFANDLLPVKDSLEAALAVEAPTVENLKSGTELTLRQLSAAFEKSVLREINPVDEAFDPNFHQAISTIESERGPNTIVSVLQKGYLLADRVLRPALVVVAKAKA
ncbi:MAG: nucleotide exchange factor GrpE [Candidatus Accumulibacter sp.]|jgi:molecular chaperone GrpE|nr:nucleotide exchange factor GrpE [Accumulibacter sp.]